MNRDETVLRRLARGLLVRSGAAAIEFGLMSPIFCLILAAAVDVSGLYFSQIKLDAGVVMAAGYAQQQVGNVNATGAAALATTLATMTANAYTTNWANATVVVNGGPWTTITAGVVTTGGTAANAGSCYCPSLVLAVFTWGSAVGCGTACSNGSLAGKFITISGSTTYHPLFSTYNIVSNGTVSSFVTLQVQ